MAAGSDALKILQYVVVAAGERAAPARAPKRAASGSLHDLLLWAVGGLLVLAASSYWIGRLSAGRARDEAPTAAASAAIELPPPTEAVASPTSTREQSVEPSVPVAVAPPSEQTTSLPPPPDVQPAAAAKADKPAEYDASRKADEPSPASDRTWPVQTVEGAAGRLVRIGRFTSASEAQKSWDTVLRKYPGMELLEVLPVPVKSLRDGHLYYRLQVGTTSQAHSEVVCDRVRNMDQSCTIIGSEEGVPDSGI